MKKLSILCAFAVAALVLFYALPANSADYNEVTIKFALSGTEQAVDYFTADYFKKKVEEESGGKVKVRIYPNNILAGGSMTEAANLLTMGGAYEMGIFSDTVLANLDPIMLVDQLPFVFDNYTDANRYLDSTGTEWAKKILSKYNLVVLGVEHNGLKQWTNNKSEKHTPADFKNFKIRIPGGEVSTLTWKALGADPVGMSWSETYTALQQGTVDGHENSYQTIYSNNIHEIQKYITEAYYQYASYWMVYNAKDFAKLNSDTQELLKKIGNEASLWGRKYLEDIEGELKEKMIASGCVINVLTPEEKQSFIDATKGVIDHFRPIYGEEAYKAWGIE
ncbi:ABC transporter substrate-binding protein [Synergistales bacterium]|nr:ABC transporter substrate-binding protein [Synergistales bacterium]